ncbi:RagB/SusD family nutrient uptake outer membrane protein [Mucilaginibacter sp. 14171R-50]|uniref:RagB/SusD family nutrient uptake outer membrane protein n=1 Tax=Mucilaginibacter sp. 14171R-50 TaxID=2703789 RepID=UPI00138DB7D8|nr:RagB/SusD family nutrient uptake outer membrane protein [Mucilaginibacter sp. 14171R-50]QHS56556.1 RagB/SusD family nutrient uptake outer membrane protein [Mucilaginibacter sp. 14171R-50]
MMKKIFLINAVLMLALTLPACRKDFLDARPNKALLVPTTPDDLRVLLDNNDVFNIRPNLTPLADGDYYTTDAGYGTYRLDMERNSYAWSKDIFAGAVAGDWNTPYKQIFYTNVVLEAAARLPEADVKEIRGTALFYRAFAYFNLVSQFAVPYDAATAASAPGVPLRLHADVTLKAGRATLAATYAQIWADLSAARPLLPVTAGYKTRSTVSALLALQARVALAMEDYPAAGRYADSALSINHTLLDYNSLNASANRPFPRALPSGNDEVTYYSALLPYSFDGPSAPTYVDRQLYDAYAPGDLRKKLFFKEATPGDFRFRGNYAGSVTLFGGLANDELYLTRAECRARAGDAAGAMADLNTLLIKRWLTGTFVPYTAANAEDALRQVLAERRKELLGRNLRWNDLRRLNRDPRFRVTLRRTVNGHTYTLEPGSARYVYPVPDEEVRLGGVVQNER